MELKSIFISNGVGVVLLALLAFVSRTKVQRRRTEDKLYTIMIIGVMLGCCMEALSYMLDGRLFPGARLLNYIANTYLFSVNLLLPFCVLVYIDLGLYGDPSRIWKKYKAQIVAGAVMFILNIVNFFVPISYYITPENVYERRPLSYVYYFVILFYVITAMVITHKYEKEHGTRSFFSIEIFLVPILLGVTLQFIFYGLSLAWLSSAIGLTGLYMMQQNEAAYIDTLTGVYNRQYLNHVAANWNRKGYRFSGMMADVDKFKRINDSFGHSEGDRALVEAASILKTVCAKNALLFRFAGDELVILLRTDDLAEIKKEEEAIKAALDAYNADSGKPYRLELSVGHAVFDPKTGDIDALMKEMDANMYEVKRLHHGE